MFSEAVFVRILIMSSLLFGASMITALIVVAIRLFSNIAIPGWTTNGFTFLLSFQALTLPITLGFLLLNDRASIQSLPKDNAARLIETVICFGSAGTAARRRKQQSGREP